MAVNFGKTLGKALGFSFKPSRWFQFFVVDFVFAMLALATIIMISPGVSFASLLDTANQVLWFLSFGAYLLPVLTAWCLVRAWVMTAVVHQAHKEKETGKSWGVASKKYPSVLGAMIIIFILSMLINLITAIPYAGGIVSMILLFILGWIVFFYLQAIVIKNLGFSGAIKESYNIFKRKALTIVGIWLALAIISMIIFGVFSIPLLILVITAIVFDVSVLAAAPGLIITGLIAAVGLAISNVFVLKAQTDFYLQLRKKRFILI